MKAKDYLITNFRITGFTDLNKDKSKIEYIGVGDKGKITYIGKERPDSAFSQKIDLKGAFLSPGWIDLHTHIYEASDIAVAPDRVGPAAGVVLPVDAGTAGEASFSGLKKYVIEPNDFPIKAYLNIGSTGIIAASRVSEIANIGCININKTINCIEKNKNIIKGIKVRASSSIVKSFGIKAVKLAKKVSRIANLPLIVHTGEPPVFVEDLIKELDQGDMITHCFNGKSGYNLLQDKTNIKYLNMAREKGILLDIGHGSASYSQKVAEKAFSIGIHPYSISTDIHKTNINGPVWGLAETMSKIMELGYNYEEIIKKVTGNPADFLKLEKWTCLEKGQPAYFTAFTIKDGKFPVEDSAARG
ncbi:MAG: amidohydrolase/deacetylase family metallohydrolase, partial [Bacillota bacterium]